MEGNNKNRYACFILQLNFKIIFCTVCVCACPCMFMEAGWRKSSVLLCWFLPYFPWGRISHWTWNLQLLAWLLVRGPWGHSYLCPLPQHWCSWLYLHVCRVSKLRSPCSCSKCSYLLIYLLNWRWFFSINFYNEFIDLCWSINLVLFQSCLPWWLCYFESMWLCVMCVFLKNSCRD